MHLGYPLKFHKCTGCVTVRTTRLYTNVQV